MSQRKPQVKEYVIPETGMDSPLTVSERAKAEFLQRVHDVPGILDVVTYGGNTLVEQSIKVTVPVLRDDIARQVVRIQGEMYRKYPGAQLHVWVTEADKD